MSSSDREVITYMADDFDLPRWANSAHNTHLPLQSAQAASGNQYPLYSQQAPPTQQQQSSHHEPARLPSLAQHQPSSTPRHPPRLQHPLDSDGHQSGPEQSSMLNIARSASLSTAGRARRQPDDLERAYASEAQSPAMANNRGQMPNPFYPSSVAYQQTANNSATTHAQTPVDGYNMFYGSGAQPSGRSHEGTNATANTPQQSQNIPQMNQYGQQQQSSGLYNSPSYGDYSSPAAASVNQDAEMRASPYVPQQSQSQTMSSQSSAYNSSSSYPSMDTHPQLSVTSPSSRPPSHSNPATPFSMQHPQYYQPSPSDQMNVEPSPGRRSVGFKRVRDARDLRPYVNPAPQGRRVGQSGQYLGPLKALTTDITHTYNLCNKQFRYETAHNPRRVLTKPSRPVHNDGFDNEDYDYILYVNDYLGTEDGQRYLILDVLGQGTFGQVVKCQNVKTGEILAVKVIKNKPAYFNQSMMEVTILQMLNNDYDPHDEHHILRLRDSFIHKNHLCLVFEQLSSNLYELIKQNQFHGLSTQLVKVFTGQLLDALIVLKEARLIHCDLKPENILLKSLQSPQIKVIDFGSACHERQTVYTYIQSRFYRSPEVLLGLPYTAAIDMWSLGCIVVELFLGLPLFPGTSEYNQITRIVELLGLPPQHMLENGKQTSQFFDRYVDAYGQTKYRLKSLEQYCRERNVQEQVGKQYFNHKTLPDIIRHAPLASSRSSSSSKQAQELERETNNRTAFIDFCQGLLNMDPLTRWTPQQAKMHPFITGDKFVRPFNPHLPQPTPSATPHIATSTPAAADPKRPFGGLLPSQPKGNRAYPDAAQYNQQLAQHQAYTAQAQAQAVSQTGPMRNPYIQPGQTYTDTNPDYNAQQQQQQAQQQHAAVTQSLQASANSRPPLAHQASAGSLGLQYNQQSVVPASATNPHPPANSFYPSRNRANTINQMDVVPPALARLQHLGNSDGSGVGRNALTPVMQREDAMREWERRQSGKANPPPAHSYPQLEYLEMAASGMTWQGGPAGSRPYAATSLTFQSQPVQALNDQDRSNTMRDAVMSSVRSAARQDPSSNSLSQAGVISAPPQAYTGGATNTANRFGTTTYPQSSSTYDGAGYDNQSNPQPLYMPIQSQQYQSYANNAGGTASHAQPQQQQPQVSQRLNLPQSPPASSTSFYAAGVVPAGQPFATQSSPHPPQQSLPRDGRRISGMDVWQR